MNPVIYSIFNTEFRDAFKRILISYAHNECCDQRRRTSSRGVTDPLVGNRIRYSTSDSRFPDQQKHETSKVAACLSNQSLNYVNDASPASSTGKQHPLQQHHYQSISKNQSATGTPTIEVIQDRSIELAFYPREGMEKRQQITAIWRPFFVKTFHHVSQDMM